MTISRTSVALAGLLALTFGLRAIRPGQPIVENYVGRQVPTAMVARNLDRGSGFLRPRLDTAPFPNLFLVEPPAYALLVVGLRRSTGLALEPAGRYVSALALTLGGWGLFGLVARREGVRAALLALAAFAAFPVTIRYGRAFQPDALMLGTLLAGLRCWDEREAGGGAGWLWLGWPLLALSLALKVVAAYILVPLVVAVLRPGRLPKVALALAMVVPALLWYLHAASLLREGVGSRASVDNGAIWLRVLIPSALLRRETFEFAARFLLVRAFTPAGFLLAVAGLCRTRGGDRLWRTWGAAVLAALAMLAAKVHHEYYWLAVAPLAAVGVGKALGGLVARNRILGTLVGGAAALLSIVQASPTWRTPPEWSALPEAARTVRARVPREAWLVAPEALLFEADRRGCRLELARGAVVRAAGEWGEPRLADGPLALVEFYRARGARYVADLGPKDPARLALHEAIRRRYNVLVDGPGFLLAALNDPQDAPDGPPRTQRDDPRLRPLEAARAEDQRPDRL